ncbi:glycoside hydrolase family 32 protein [Vibrio vulnificus]|uniref:glycoside hydrolase family 32 protein n=1 Tax=Vibrio vulnificus TaxID=672 RepID=UPI003EDB0114
MSLEQLIALAGGIENIQRILAPEGAVTVAVTNPECINPLDAKRFNDHNISAEWVLGEYQLCMVRDESITDDDFAQVGLQIAAKQRQNASQHLEPNSSHFRPLWHISPPQGLLNDPNGFIYHRGEYYLFYQWHPFACQHKDKYWVLLKSRDLIDWHWQSIALTPSDWFDSHGVFSGHALSHDDALYLFYTGNTRLGQNRDRQTTQCAAKLNANGHFDKLGPLIRSLPEGVTPHIRDPKVIVHQGQWKMLLGAQTEALQGRLAVYHSEDLLNWTFDRLYGDELGDYGYMWECPDWFEMAGEQFVVFGPQGIQSDNPHHTVEHQNRIFRVANGGFTLLEGWELDAGFDFYAPQTLQTEDGRRVLCAWMGLPDEVDHPSCDHGWLHQLTALRELRWHNGQLLQTPLAELTTLRNNMREVELNADGLDLETKSFELIVNLEWGCELHLMANEQHKVVLTLDETHRMLRLDRSNTLIRQGDTVRELSLASDTVKLHILADQSSLEIFINQGEQVMSARVFTAKDATRIALHNGKAMASVAQLVASQAPFANVGE